MRAVQGQIPGIACAVKTRIRISSPPCPPSLGGVVLNTACGRWSTKIYLFHTGRPHDRRWKKCLGHCQPCLTICSGIGQAWYHRLPLLHAALHAGMLM